MQSKNGHTKNGSVLGNEVSSPEGHGNVFKTWKDELDGSIPEGPFLG